MLSDKVDKFFNKKVTIYRLLTTQDKFGGTKNEWEKQDWVVPCRLYGYVGVMTIDVLGQTYPVVMQMMIKNDIDIKLGDRIVDESEKYIVVRIIPRALMSKANHKTLLLGRYDE